ncbi:MAG TPA: non-canonical purine NTP pyrophosphatase [Candidatus Saccharimonadales bacterium]|nr:non-canonical purine NTP pyrophosphatase [Candidatus Saccharimonadales bacterium]
MQTITIVTGNPGKVRELQAMAEGKLNFAMHSLNLPEIQSLDLQEVIEDKLRRAYAELKTPVIVDDVSAGLDKLKGLPGTFIKFFNETLGEDSLFQLAGKEGEKVTVSCIAAYYDGTTMVLGKGTIRGSVVTPRGSNGFGFDSVIVPDGQSRTMAEMSEEEKMQVSHRGKAFRDLITQLEQNKP